MSGLTKALSAGVDFLVAGQDPDGAWRDFDLTPGKASSWTTAYIAAALERAAGGGDDVGLALADATRFLRANRTPRGGWAYNQRCAADADSTALALLFLAAKDPPPSLSDVAALARFQGSGGGFGTYGGTAADNAWRDSHAEVTVTALRALSLFLPADHAILTSTRLWLDRRPTAPDLVTYWWTTPAYLALELTRHGVPFADVDDPDTGAFATALRLERHVLLASDGERLDESPAILMAMKLADGSWPSTPILRVPNPAAAPGSEAARADRPNADQHRLFTTATAVSALAAAVKNARDRE